MGYQLHVTRTADWSESEKNPIRPEEWLAVVAGDGELILQADDENGPYYAVWSGPEGNHPGYSWFDWDEGRVYTQNFTDYPDTLQIDKLLQIAEKLQAHVQGDGGETYPLRDDEPSTMASEASPSYAPSRLGLLVAFVVVNTLLVAVAAWAYRYAPRAQKVPVWFEAYAFYAIFTCVVAVSWAFFGKPLFRRWVSLPGHWLWYGQKGLDLSGLIAAPALLACIVGKLFGLF